MNKKGQTGGLITGLVFGVASLVIGVIIAFVIVSTLTEAELLTGTRTTATTTNETGAYLNQTGYTLTNYNSGTTKAISVTTAWNYSSGEVIPAANYSISAVGVLVNATNLEYESVNVTYAITTESVEEASTDDLSANFTEGIDNVSDKIPTVLLVAAIVLILGVLAILVGVWQRMRMGGGTQL